MKLHGTQLIGFEFSKEGEGFFQATNPATGEKLPTHFYRASDEELDRAAQKAQLAFQVYRKKSGLEKALFLEAIAQEIESIGDDLIQIATSETGLPAARIQGERGLEQRDSYACLPNC